MPVQRTAQAVTERLLNSTHLCARSEMRLSRGETLRHPCRPIYTYALGVRAGERAGVRADETGTCCLYRVL